VIIIDTKNKDWIASFIIACFVSLLFYYVNQNAVTTRSCFYYGWYLDNLYLIEFGVFLPYLLPLGLLIKNRLEEPYYVWGY